MNSISISRFKINPSKAIREASEIPVAIEKRNQVKAYLVGKELYERIVFLIEDFIDRQAVEKTDFTKGRNFETVAQKLFS